jgi:hypothetical protein
MVTLIVALTANPCDFLARARSWGTLYSSSSWALASPLAGPDYVLVASDTGVMGFSVSTGKAGWQSAPAVGGAVRGTPCSDGINWFVFTVSGAAGCGCVEPAQRVAARGCSIIIVCGVVGWVIRRGWRARLCGACVACQDRHSGVRAGYGRRRFVWRCTHQLAETAVMFLPKTHQFRKRRWDAS